jgi:hypothetical protein
MSRLRRGGAGCLAELIFGYDGYDIKATPATVVEVC